MDISASIITWELGYFHCHSKNQVEKKEWKETNLSNTILRGELGWKSTEGWYSEDEINFCDVFFSESKNQGTESI